MEFTAGSTNQKKKPLIMGPERVVQGKGLAGSCVKANTVEKKRGKTRDPPGRRKGEENLL